MREFELTIDEALRVGLTPADINSFNVQVLTGCLGFRVGSAMLELYEEKENPLPPIIDMHYNWPFPQYIPGESHNFLVVRDATVQEDIVYSINNDHTIVTHIYDIDELTYGRGNLMEVADFGEYVFMTNGVIMIYWDPSIVDWRKVVVEDDIPMLETICNFKGQTVGGGVRSTWHDCDETFYVWSMIGQMDFTPDRKNTAGYRRCPFGGRVLNVRRLENKVVGYSTAGITLLSPVDEPVVTFGFSELDDIGILNKGAVASSVDFRRHVYVGKDYRLRQVTNEGVKLLGYKQSMDDLSGEDIIVSYDPVNKDFYIGNSTKTFLLSAKGLSEIPQHPSAVWGREGETYILPDAIDDYEALIISEGFDFGYRGQKTIFSVETDMILADNPQAAIDYYLSPSVFGTTGFVPINHEGIAPVIAAGSAFAVRIKFDPTYDNTRIGYIKVRYKMTDLRGLRGVYASPPRGQDL